MMATKSKTTPKRRRAKRPSLGQATIRRDPADPRDLRGVLLGLIGVPAKVPPDEQHHRDALHALIAIVLHARRGNAYDRERLTAVRSALAPSDPVTQTRKAHVQVMRRGAAAYHAGKKTMAIETVLAAFAEDQPTLEWADAESALERLAPGHPTRGRLATSPEREAAGLRLKLGIDGGDRNPRSGEQRAVKRLRKAASKK